MMHTTLLVFLNAVVIENLICKNHAWLAISNILNFKSSWGYPQLGPAGGTRSQTFNLLSVIWSNPSTLWNVD